jgi:hypothetical protein
MKSKRRRKKRRRRIVVVVVIINIKLLLLLLMMLFSCHRPLLPGTSLEPTVIPTTNGSSFRLLYFPYYV